MDAKILAAALQQSCPTCKAQPGEPCIAPRKQLPHVTRQDKGVRQMRRDYLARSKAEDAEYDRQVRAQRTS